MGPDSGSGDEAPVETVPEETAQASDTGNQDTVSEQGSESVEAPTEQAVETAEPANDANASQQSILYEEEGPNGEPGSASVGDVQWTLEGRAMRPLSLPQPISRIRV